MEEKLRGLLIANAGVTAIAGTRVKWNEAPQATELPMIVLHRIAGTREYRLSGPEGFVESRVQADCFGKTYEAAVALKRAVTSALSGVGDDTGVPRFEAIRFVGELHRLDKPDDQEPRHRVSLDFEFWHEE